jgi:biopolymer transport protein ExbD
MGRLSLGHKKGEDSVNINMSPMVDMTFLLLIFFWLQHLCKGVRR